MATCLRHVTRIVIGFFIGFSGGRRGCSGPDESHRILSYTNPLRHIILANAGLRLLIREAPPPYFAADLSRRR